MMNSTFSFSLLGSTASENDGITHNKIALIKIRIRDRAITMSDDEQ